MKYSKKYFKNYAHRTNYLKQKNNPTYNKRLQEILFLKKRKGNLLDIGCAFGFFLDKARQAGFNTYGIDISKYALSKVKKKHQVYQIDASQQKLPFKNNFFSVIVCDNTLEHLKNPIFALQEAKRVLKNKGLIFICVPLRERWCSDSSHCSYFNQLSLQFILKKFNFQIIHIGEEGGKLRNLFGLIRLLFKRNTLFNFVPAGTGSFLIVYAKKIKQK